MEECGYAWIDLLMDVRDGAFGVVDESTNSGEGAQIWQVSFLIAATYEVLWLAFCVGDCLFPLLLDLAFRNQRQKGKIYVSHPFLSSPIGTRILFDPLFTFCNVISINFPFQLRIFFNPDCLVIQANLL